jgi:hypothetical protein
MLVDQCHHLAVDNTGGLQTYLGQIPTQQRLVLIVSINSQLYTNEQHRPIF